MGATCSSESSVDFQHDMRCYFSEDRTSRNYWENPRPYVMLENVWFMTESLLSFKYHYFKLHNEWDVCSCVFYTNKQRIPKDCPCHKFYAIFWSVHPIQSTVVCFLHVKEKKNLLHCVIGSWINELCLDCCRWYFGKIKRIEAEKKLLLPENDHGAFLIRDSESRRNDYSLSGEQPWYRRQNYCLWHLVNKPIVGSQH